MGDRLLATSAALQPLQEIADLEIGISITAAADLPALAEIVDRPAGLADRRHPGYAGILGGKVRPRTGASFHAVNVDRVGIALHRHPHVIVNARGTELELDRDLPVRRLADLVDLEREIIGTQPVRMPGRRTLVDTCGQAAHL